MPVIYLYDEEKDDFKEIKKVSTTDVAFIVFQEEQKLFIWQGKEAPRMTKYKAGSKAPTLMSKKQYYGFKQEVIEEGDEPPLVKQFLDPKKGSREESREDVAKTDRELVQSRVKEISEKYKHEQDESVTTPESLKVLEDQAYHDLKLKLAQAATAKPTQEESGATKVPIEMPAERPVNPPVDSNPKESIKEELKRTTTSIGRGMVPTGLSTDQKKELTMEERQILDDVRKEQGRSDNLLNVQTVQLLDEERKEKLRREEEERIRKLELEKRRVEELEKDRLAHEQQLIKESIQKERETLESERRSVEDRLKNEEIERKNRLQQEAQERADRQDEKIQFEVRKIDLRMQLRKKGVDYINRPPAGTQSLYRIEKGKAVQMPQEYLTTADVYLLDKGDDAFVWNGNGASLDEQFFGEEIAKLLKEKRGGNLKVNVIKQYEEPTEFLLSFDSLLILDGDYSRSVLKLDEARSATGLSLYRIKTEAGYLFQEMPMNRDSISSDDSFLFDNGENLIIWHGHGANPTERQHSEEITNMFARARKIKARVQKIEEGSEPAYDQLPHDVWVLIKGEENANVLKAAHERTVLAVETHKREMDLKQKQEAEVKRIDDDKRALDEMERVERQLLEKEIERKKSQFTPQQIEGLWKDFRKKMRVRRGLPEEEEESKFEVQERQEAPIKSVESVEKTSEQVESEKKAEREAKAKELEQLKRIELEMLEKKIARDKPSPEIEAKWRADLDEKMRARWKELEI